MAASTSFPSLTSFSRAPSPPSSPTAPIYKYLLNLAVLNLPANHLSGDIPQQLALCAYLNIIDLHDNQLSGLIQQQLGLLVRLSVFDVSNNKISGLNLPSLGNRSGNLPHFNASSYAGNKGLYGYHMPPMKSSGLSVLAIVGIALGCGPSTMTTKARSASLLCPIIAMVRRRHAEEEEEEWAAFIRKSDVKYEIW
ncbi:hypothetical protein OROMI_024408 [Orobanche minor]